MSDTHYGWRHSDIKIDYTNTHGFRKSPALEEMRGNGHTLPPCHSFSAAALEDSREPFRYKTDPCHCRMARTTGTAPKGVAAIESNLERTRVCLKFGKPSDW